MTPVVGYIDNVNVAAMNPSDEVGDIFTVPLEDLLDPSKQDTQPDTPSQPSPYPMRLKIYTAGPWPIWGLTAYITEQILKEMVKVPPCQIDS